MKYEKTPDDAAREKSDLTCSPIMRFMKNQDAFKFNVGDIIIKQRKSYYRHGEDEQWETELTSVKSPKKYMYVFENELGIGYLKQLRVDGSGFTSQLICTVNFDPENTRFILDPDFVDHIMLGEDGNFQYNQDYLVKKKFREEAIAKNSKILTSTRSVRKTLDWFYSLDVGSEFYMGNTFDEMVANKYQVTTIRDAPVQSMPSHIYDRLTIHGTKHLQGKYRSIEVSHITTFSQNAYLQGHQTLTADYFLNRKVTQEQPFPLTDELCGRPK